MWKLILVSDILSSYSSIDQSVWIEFIQMLDQGLSSHALSVWHLVGLVDHCFNIPNTVFIKSIFSIGTIIQAIILFNDLLKGWCGTLMKIKPSWDLN